MKLQQVARLRQYRKERVVGPMVAFLTCLTLGKSKEEAMAEAKKWELDFQRQERFVVK